MPRSRKAAPPCPDCGKPLSLGGRFCRTCGWDADLPESEDAHLGGVNVPEAMPGEDYEDLLADEGLGPPPRLRGRRLLWRATAALLLATMLWLLLRYGTPW